MGFAIVFAVALVGLVALFGFKMWEIKRGTALFKKQRKILDTYLEDATHKSYEHLIALPRRISLRHLAHSFAHEAILFFAKVAKFADVKAESLAMRISHSAREHRVGRKKQASDFLREVSEHKESLDRKEIKRETRL